MADANRPPTSLVDGRWLTAVDAALADGVDPFLAVVLTDPRNTGDTGRLPDRVGAGVQDRDRLTPGHGAHCST